MADVPYLVQPAMAEYGGPLARISVMYDNTVRYRYTLDESDPHGDYCEFSMLCEVGEPYQHLFSTLIEQYGLVLGPAVELEAYPWMADTIAS